MLTEFDDAKLAAEATVSGTIHYFVAPPRARDLPTIVFLPGLFGGAWKWRLAYRHARNRGWRAIVFKDSFAKIPTDGRRPLLALHGLIAKLIADEPPHRVVLCGSSLGGLAAIDFALVAQKPVSVVGSGIPGIGKADIAGRPLMPRTHEEMRSLLSVAVFDKTLLDRDLTDDVVGDYLSCFTDRQHFANMMLCLQEVQRYPLIANVRRLPGNLSLIWGREDEVTRYGLWADTFAPEIAAGAIRVRLIDECGHTPMLEKPDEFNRAVEAVALAAVP